MTNKKKNNKIKLRFNKKIRTYNTKVIIIIKSLELYKKSTIKYQKPIKV